MTKTEPTKTDPPRRLILTAINIMHALVHVNFHAIPVLYPLLRKQFAFGYLGIAFLTLTLQIANGSIQIAFGALTRLARRFHILGMGNALLFLGTIIMTVSQNYAHLIIGTAARGLGSSPFHPVGGAIMAATLPQDQAKALGLYRTAGAIGTVIAPLMVGALLQGMGWRSVIFILGIPFLCVSILCFVLNDPSHQINIQSPGKKRDRFGLQEYKALFQDRNALIISLTMMVSAGGRIGGVLKTYLAVILVDRFGISAAMAALFFTIFTIGELFGPLSLGWLADRTTPLIVVRLNLVLSAAFLLLLLIPATPGVLLAVTVFMIGFFIGSRTSLMQALLIQSGPQDARIETQLSLYFTIGAISGPLWAVLVGVLVDRFGLASAIWTMALSFVFGMIILSFIKRERSAESGSPQAS